MREYKRSPKSKLHDTVKRYASGQPEERKASILTEVHELPQRDSLLRMQRDMAGLLRSRQKIARRIARAEREDNSEQVFVLVKLLARQTEALQAVAQDVAKARSEIVLAAKPAPKKRNTRNTIAHSKVRKVRATKAMVKAIEAKVQKPKPPEPDTTRQIADRQALERQDFLAELQSRK